MTEGNRLYASLRPMKHYKYYYILATMTWTGLHVQLNMAAHDKYANWGIPCQVNQIFSTFEPDPLGFFSNLAHHMYHCR